MSIMWLVTAVEGVLHTGHGKDHVRYLRRDLREVIHFDYPVLAITVPLVEIPENNFNR